MVWKVEFHKDAEKELDKLDKQHARRILKYMFERIATKESPRRFGEQLQHDLSGLWKYRIGEFRVICNINDDTVTVMVLRVGHRSKVCRDAKK